MYPGHFAAGLALKTIKPEAPTWALLVGVGLLDWLFGLFVALGVEGGKIGHLNIPWSHSLVMSIVWSGLFASLFWRRGRAIVLIMFVAVMSHWVLDLLSHQPDMTLWPYASKQIGLGPYFGGLAGWLEVLVTVVATTWYAISAKHGQGYGRHWGVVCGIMAVLYGVEYLTVP